MADNYILKQLNILTSCRSSPNDMEGLQDNVIASLGTL